MDNSRRRMAIATFASAGDVERTTQRLRALGIAQCERFSLPADQKHSDLARSGAGWPLGRLAGSTDSKSAMLLLRIMLETPDQEQLVTRALLDSDARSVQLHDIDPQADL
jgi:hypothetical protein